MEINLSKLFNNQNINTNQNPEGEVSSTSLRESANLLKNVVNSNNSENAITVLKNMLAGDTFSGLVTNVSEGSVEILLNQNVKINASLSKGVNISKGENLTFMVEDNQNGKVHIRPLDSNGQANTVINRALEAANLPVNEKNINIVKELLSLNMPINKETITNLARQMAKFPEANLNSLANLTRLNIPINKENIGQFEAYKQFDAKIEQSLNTLESDFFKDLEGLINNKDQAGNLATKGDAQGNNPSNLVGNPNEANASALGENVQNLQKDNLANARDILKSTINNLYNGVADSKDNTLDTFLSKESLNNLASLVSDKELASQIKDGSITTRDLVTKLFNSENALSNENLAKLIGDKDFKSLFHELINETMKLSPKEVGESEDAINEFYNKLKKNVDELSKDLKNLNISPQTEKNVDNLKNNINFMNELNRNLMFMQMPIKFSDSEGNGELYVFSNKKNLKYDPDNISAMLHLDMENLGPLDIYVKLTNKTNLSTNFVLESDEMLDFIYEHIDKLEKRLSELGYDTHFEMKTNDEAAKSFDFVRDFIERDLKKSSPIETYIFDTKA